MIPAVMGIDRECYLPVECERTLAPVIRHVVFDAEFNSPHIIQVKCPHYSGVASCRLARLNDAQGLGCLYWMPESVSESERINALANLATEIR